MATAMKIGTNQSSMLKTVSAKSWPWTLSRTWGRSPMLPTAAG